MNNFFIFCLALITFCVQAQDCTPIRYRQLMREADQATFGNKPDYQLAVNKLLSAKTCQPDSEAVVNLQLVKVFEEVNRQRELAVRNEAEAKKQTKLAVKNADEARQQERIAKMEKERAEAEARRIYANDLAFKSQTALRDGDINKAFKLAEFAQRFVEEDNPLVMQALMDAFYYNDNPRHAPIPGLVVNFEDHKSSITNIAFSPDNKYLAFISSIPSTNTVKILDIKKRKVKVAFPLQHHSGSSNLIVFSPDGNHLAVAVSTGNWFDFKIGSEAVNSRIYIWNIQNGMKVDSIELGECSVNTMAFLSDGNSIAFTCGITAKIWNLQSKQATITYENKLHERSICFSSDGKYLVSASIDSIKIWDIANNRLVVNFDIQAVSVFKGMFSPNGKYLAVILGYAPGINNSVVIWDLENRQVLRTFEGRGIHSIDFSSNENYFSTLDIHAIKIWDLRSGQMVNSFIGAFSGMAFSSDSRQFASYAGVLKIWNLSTKQAALSLTDNLAMVKSIAFSPDGSRLATVFLDTTKIWDLDSGQPIFISKNHQKNIGSVSFSSDGKCLALLLSDTTKVWDLENNRLVCILKNPNFEFNNVDHLPLGSQLVAFSADGKFLAIAFQSTAVIWDLESGQIVYTHEVNDKKAKCVAFSPDNKQLAIGYDSNLDLLDLQSDSVSTFEGCGSFFSSITFSPNGKYLAANSDNKIKVFNLLNGKMLILNGHINWVSSISFSPDGEHLASASGDISGRDDKVRIWNLESGRTVFNLVGHKQVVSSVAFSPDGGRLATISWDKTVKIWEMRPQKMFRHWQENEGLAGLNFYELQDNSLYELLDIRPGNEQLLLKTQDTWQIAAFADLYTQKISETGFPQKTDYDRATRLYQACLDSGTDNAYFQQKMEDLKRIWKEK